MDLDVRYPVVLCDLDGVVWLAHRPIPGSVDAIARLRASGRRVVFVTNNSSLRLADHTAALERIGVPAEGDVLSSALAAGELIEPGESVLAAGGPGVVEAIELRRGVVVGDHSVPAGERWTSESPIPAGIDAVVVGFHRDFHYEEMRIAATAVRNGARLIATNDDATYPTPDGPIPGGGSIVASIATASGVEPVVAGKPRLPMARAVARLVSCEVSELSGCLMVGDRLETDGDFATTLGADFALVRSGVTTAETKVAIRPALDAANLASIVDSVLA